MDYLVISAVALIVSGLTLFSGFGLGTVLMPAFALFFPVPVAIAATAVVHLANNLFKLVLLGRNADWRVALKFSLPAAIAAGAGASLLKVFANLPALAAYDLGGRTHEITAVGAAIGSLIVLFATARTQPKIFRTQVSAPVSYSGRLALGIFWRSFRQSGGLARGLPDQGGNDERSFHCNQRCLGGDRRCHAFAGVRSCLRSSKL